MPAKADLSIRGIRAIDPLAAETTWDTKIQGFGLRTRRDSDTAKWRWVLAYREGGRGSAQVKLSEKFSTMTPDEARKWAEKEKGRKGTALGQRAIATEVQRVRTAERLSPNMQRLWEEYWESEGHLKKAADTYKQLWRDHLAPTFATMKVRDVEPQTVEGFKVRKSKTPGACNRSLSLLSRLFSLSVRWGYRKGCAPEHPVKGIVRYPEMQSEFFFTREELERILVAADMDCDPTANEAAKLTGHATNRSGGLIIRLLALTGARMGEATKAHWGQFEFLSGEDGGGALWTVESTNTKIGRPITRYLDTDMARRLLEWKPVAVSLQTAGTVVTLRPTIQTWWAFPQMTDPTKPMLQLHHVWDRVLKRAGVRQGRIHDLRHTAATLTLRATKSLTAVQAQLGHATPLTTRRYAHLMREQMIETGSILGAFGEVRVGPQSAAVVPIRPTKKTTV